MSSIIKNAIMAASIVTALLTSSTAFSQPASASNAAPKWVASTSAGVTLTRGNSDTVLFTANILAARKWDKNELRLGADGTYGENNKVKNAESAHGFGQYNRLFNEKMFGYLRMDALHDGVADVEYRLTFSPGAGYYFIKNAKTILSAEVGPGFVMEKLGSGSKEYLSLRIGERFEHKINERVRMWESLEFLPQVDEWKNFILNAEIGVETGLTESLSLRVYAQDTYDNVPAPTRDKNDLKVVTAIAYKFK
ncbi:MAG: DUF481 domain-containing protein [Pedosphaera sp.]|nr:DUF481 domain-containing protein [Pedosphaera sp.]